MKNKLELNQNPLPSQTSIRVRYSETDKMGVVYYANFLVWFEVGRTDYCRKTGFTYKDMEEDGLLLSVAEATCRYRSPAYYDDLLTVHTHLQSLKKRILYFEYKILRDNENKLLATGKTAHIITNCNGQPQSLPKKYHSLLQEGLR